MGVLETLGSIFSAIGTALSTIWAVFCAALPFMGLIILLAVVSVFLKCLQRQSMDPFWDFYHKIWNMFTGIGSFLAKLVDLITGPLT